MSENQYVPEFLVYNNFGIRPTEACFQLDCKTLKEIVGKIASQAISGVEDVTMQHDKNGNVAMFVWFIFLPLIIIAWLFDILYEKCEDIGDWICQKLKQ